MLTAEAHIATDRPGRYLAQLCKHFDNKGRHLSHRPRTHTLPDLGPDQIQVEWTDSDGTLRLPWGQCTLQAVPGTLRVRVEADDRENLERLQELVSTHIGRFSRRDPLRVEWQPSGTSVDAPGEATVPPRQRHGGRTRFIVIGVAAVAVALHLALGGTALAHTPWTGWVVGFLVTVVVAKAALVGGLALHRHRSRIG
ncbi:DUF2218 domain-containing protein [Streptomyces sp. NBC_01478]|jgi:hypothetical protein|uniref:DUF2218 domain-containing protein n=1 Tax=Streptomyces sp. NBC_01478 TaxID=2903882 RepID=UPI002E32A42E|nr:DUF2218 domain-containing protein [Streptomyces sp. NBC_01478]